MSLLSNLFPCRGGAGGGGASSNSQDSQQGIVRPYHKSVLDWLIGADAGEYQVDERLGHYCLAQACRNVLNRQADERQVSLVGGIALTAGVGLLGLPAVDIPSQIGRTYAARHAVAHACLSGDAALVETILHNLSLWEAAYTAGTQRRLFMN